MPRSALTQQEIMQSIDPTRHPPILTPEQAADLMQIAKPTLYKWVCQGKLDTCVRRRKPLRFWRDRLILAVFNGQH